MSGEQQSVKAQDEQAIWVDSATHLLNTRGLRQFLSWHRFGPAVTMATSIFNFITRGGLAHWLAKHVILRPVWLWYCLRARSFWFFTPSNPTITFGGFMGESRTLIYKQLPLGTFPATALITPDMSGDQVEQLASDQGFVFPLMAMPDVRTDKWMSRQVDTAEHLHQYHRAMPVPYILQEMEDYPVEVSVFYHRFPSEQSGHISGIVRRENEQVVNIGHENDSALLSVFDSISRHSNSFYYGCYRIKCRSIDALKEGRNFSILEYRGAGADFYVPGKSLFQACCAILERWNILYRISLENHKRGIPCWHHASGGDFVSHIRHHGRLLRRLDRRFEFADAVETVFIPPSLMPFAQKYARSLSPHGDGI